VNSTATTPAPAATALESRILREGYGSEAWHGPDMKAAVSNVSADLAFWRPGVKRHNIAEIAVHHAFYVRAVRGRLLGTPPEKFILEGEDWFPLSTGSLAWTEILQLLESEQRKLVDTVSRIGDGRATSPLSEAERLDLVLGITCHAVYHAGQIQLIKVLNGST
jgi:hypothetical protein